MRKFLIILASVLMLVVGVGCATLSHLMTPTEVDQRSKNYVIEKGAGEEEDYRSWLWPNLADAQKLDEDLDIAHDMEQFRLQQELAKDTKDYSHCKKVSSQNVISGLQREEALFGEKGLLSLGLSLAGMGTLTGYLGLRRKRPGDLTPQDMEKALAEATGKTAEELSAKQKQFVQVISGVSTLMKDWKTNSPDLYEKAKAVFNTTQDTETQVAVATAKKESLVG